MVYEYKCQTCGCVFEVTQRITDDKFKEHLCPCCESVQPVKRLVGAPPFFLKGGGWAKDGYSNKPKSD